MNKINLINSSAHLTKYDIFSMYRSTWLRDALCVYVLGPLSLFGAFFNLISMIILYRKKFKSRPLYTYLKVLHDLGEEPVIIMFDDREEYYNSISNFRKTYWTGKQFILDN